jgi:hypothetical protein
LRSCTAKCKNFITTDAFYIAEYKTLDIRIVLSYNWDKPGRNP